MCVCVCVCVLPGVDGVPLIVCHTLVPDLWPASSWPPPQHETYAQLHAHKQHYINTLLYTSSMPFKIGCAFSALSLNYSFSWTFYYENGYLILKGTTTDHPVRRKRLLTLLSSLHLTCQLLNLQLQLLVFCWHGSFLIQESLSTKDSP